MYRMLKTGVAAVVAILAVSDLAAAEQPRERHGLSLMGDLKYGPDFKHFDYVNPNAPKGGRLRLSAIGSFDSLNPFIVKGQAAGLVGYIYDTLMTFPQDEPGSEYGLIARSVRHPEDYSWVIYTLRPEARWHDGKPVTPEDVIFSLEALKKGHPLYAHYYANITRAEKVGDHEVKFTFNQKGNRELPQITGQLYVLPKHYWEGTDANGRKRDFFSTTLEPPLGSGPYRIRDIKPGKSLSVERVPDYWGKDLPVNVGRYNFDEIQREYFRDTTVALEAFKAGRFDVHIESSAKNWATAFEFPAVGNGDVIRDVLTSRGVEPMQAFAFNIRRPKFADSKVRLAFNHAFNFEWANKNLFFGQYRRVNSYFANSELAATGLPAGREFEILETVRDQVPPEVFTTEYTNPVNNDQTDVRRNLRKARKLLEEAGWSIRGGKLVNAKNGEAMKVEFLLGSPSFERVVLPYTQSLKRLGIETEVRTVDSAQYQRRMETFDFDIAVGTWAQSLSPGNEQRDFWGSGSADRNGSRNLVGIENPAIDKLIERIIFARDREDLIASTRALDRVLLWNHYLVPQWYFNGVRLARWNRFSFPKTRPDYGTGYPGTWWYDPAKAATIGDKP